jgi:hypothetical protein
VLKLTNADPNSSSIIFSALRQTSTRSTGTGGLSLLCKCNSSKQLLPCRPAALPLAAAVLLVPPLLLVLCAASVSGTATAAAAAASAVAAGVGVRVAPVSVALLPAVLLLVVVL